MTDAPERNARRPLARMAPVRQPGAFVFAAAAPAPAAGRAPAALGWSAEAEGLSRIPRPTPLPTGIEGWLRVFAGPRTADPGAAEAEALRAEAARRLAPWLRDAAAGCTADDFRLRLVARRSA